MTDLGESGNIATAREFFEYVKAHPKGTCHPSREDIPRVLVTGFGLFQGIRYNPTGSLVEMLHDPKFPDVEAKNVVLEDSDHGGKIRSRYFEINGRSIELCLAILDVKWDLAGAILAYEMRHFRPHLVLMLGRGGQAFEMEGGALNKATGSPGYGSDGKPLPEINKPKSEWILKDVPVGQEIKMTWEHLKWGPKLKPLAQELGFELKIHKEARPDNNYICNNLSLVAARAASGHALSLAGGKIVLKESKRFEAPQVGFLHFPAIDSKVEEPKNATAQILGFSEMVLSFVQFSLGL